MVQAADYIEDEARLAARIRHSNVVQTLDVVALDRELLLVMEYVHGESLAECLRAARARREAIPADIVSAIVCAVLHGLHAAHEATDEQGVPLGIVHRDVGPQNVLVGRVGGRRPLRPSSGRPEPGPKRLRPKWYKRRTTLESCVGGSGTRCSPRVQGEGRWRGNVVLAIQTLRFANGTADLAAIREMFCGQATQGPLNVV